MVIKEYWKHDFKGKNDKPQYTPKYPVAVALTKPKITEIYIFSDKGATRGAKFRTVFGAYEEGDPKIVMGNAIMTLMKTNDITLPELQEIINFAKKNGGFSHAFVHSGNNEGGSKKMEKAIFDSASGLTIKKVQGISGSFQIEAKELGILSGRTENLKEPLVGLRLAFALAICKNHIINHYDGFNKESATETLSDKKDLVVFTLKKANEKANETESICI